jgi:ATP-dependent DNA ligase
VPLRHYRGAFDGVLVGECAGDALHYRGVVEWGFKAAGVLALLEHARRWSRPGSPFVERWRARSVTWVEARLEAEVSYAEIVEGRLRTPSWRGLFNPALFLRTAPRPAR